MKRSLRLKLVRLFWVVLIVAPMIGAIQSSGCELNDMCLANCPETVRRSWPDENGRRLCYDGDGNQVADCCCRKAYGMSNASRFVQKGLT